MPTTKKTYESTYQVKVRHNYGNEGDTGGRANETHSHVREKLAEKVREIPGIDHDATRILDFDDGYGALKEV